MNLLRDWIVRSGSIKHARPFARFEIMTLTIQQIRKTMANLATIIETAPDGQKYWPLFEGLERELATRLDRSARLAAARGAVRRDEIDG